LSSNNSNSVSTFKRNYSTNLTIEENFDLPNSPTKISRNQNVIDDVRKKQTYNIKKGNHNAVVVFEDC